MRRKPWTIEQFEEAYEVGRIIAPKSVIRYLHPSKDEACFVGALMLGAGFELRPGVDQSAVLSHGQEILRFQDLVGFSTNEIQEITDVNDSISISLGRDNRCMDKLKEILDGHA